MRSFDRANSSTRKFQKSTVDNSADSFDNILKRANIKIYAYRDKFVLVNSGKFAFLMFEKLPENHQHHNSSIHPTVRLVDIAINCKLSALPVAQYIPFSQLSNANLRYMCESYSRSKFAKYPYRSKNERIDRFILKYKVSPRFAKLLAKLDEAADFKAICRDIREANTFLEFHPNLLTTLKDGADNEKVEILKKLLPEETFKILGLNLENHWIMNTVVNEIITKTK